MKIKTILLACLLLLLGGLLPNSVWAQDFTPCGGDSSANAIVSVPVGAYDLYARIAQNQTSESANLFIQKFDPNDTDSNCKNYSSTVVSGNSYTKILDSYNSDGNPVIIYFASASSQSMQTAAAPQIVFIPHSNPPCKLIVECSIVYNNIPMTLSPKKISLTSDSLRVGLLLAISGDDIKKVIYTIDSKPAYERPVLQSFDERYVPGGEHTVGRTILLKSGQTLSDTRSIEKGTSIDIGYFFTAYLLSQSTTVLILICMIALFIIWASVLAILRKIQKRRIWKQTHIAGYTYKIDATKTGAQKIFYDESVGRTLYRYRIWWLGALGITAVVIVCTTFIVSTFTVDGVSMLPTLQDTSIHPLVKIQRTISKINRSEYVPSRGTIVVVEKDENNLFDPAAAAEKHYVVKRVVGLPGERITVKKGKILVYNKDQKEGFEPDASYNWTTMLEGSEQFNIDITLKDSELFIVGDHRDESIDSRFYGPINTSQVVGSVIK